MCDVYRDSFITITALGASSSEEGLFALGDPLLYSLAFYFRRYKGEIYTEVKIQDLNFFLLIFGPFKNGDG
jgi:hypothetical protein